MTLPAGSRGEHDGEEARDASAHEAEQQLLLDEENDTLPWLEDDGDYPEESGFDARLIWLTLVGLIVVAALVFGAWWVLRDRPDDNLIADGSTIEAPDGPYKERPEDPGGREVEGTGDTAFEVAEGQATRGRLAEEEAPAPSIDREQADSQTETASGNEVYVQIGAYTNTADADTAWRDASHRYPVLSGMRHRVVEAEVNGAKVYRLQVIAGNRESGDATCRAIRNAGGDCYIR
ncbi:SPOR domain-containing protein [Aurantiacibacter poecillastricola]|uniref:SPOR domain-containing protein n=1 Tax=Aurantiacibacter poecillastricola TaxID=3064385 RepID=UPI0027401B76|nr:SPOR domain-containing protein [Aurantiacibacter sp. 219JJ12-13]MDP5262839.1 SPOR domain-containing protein [Aurantiacibacter sp. 219JJ12-13]